MNIVVLAGGRSSERNVSLNSGVLVWKILNEINHNAVLIDIAKGITNDNIKIEDMFRNKMSFVDEESIETTPYKKTINTYQFFERDILEICKFCDVVFIALHGEDGEDGKIQGLLDLYNIKYTGSNHMSSAIAMNKYFTKKILQSEKIRVPSSVLINKDITDFTNIIEKVKIPCVIKPVNGGSSIGVTIVKNVSDIEDAIGRALENSDNILVEQYIEGREFSVGILGQQVLPVIEIIADGGFYDYFNKYHSEMTYEICPAHIPDKVCKNMKEIAQNVAMLLGLRDYCRIDFILDHKNQIYCLEANSLPGLTQNSLLPQEAKAMKIEFSQLCDMIVKMALKH